MECVNDWSKLGKERSYESTGQVHVRATGPVAVYVTQEGVECLLGYGAEVKGRYTTSVLVRVVGDAEVWALCPCIPVTKPHGEVLTNFEKMPLLSDEEAAARQAIRLAQVELRRMLFDIRQEAAEVRAARSAGPSPQPEPEPEPEPDPEPEPVDTPEVTPGE